MLLLRGAYVFCVLQHNVGPTFVGQPYLAQWQLYLPSALTINRPLSVSRYYTVFVLFSQHNFSLFALTKLTN